MTDKKSVPTYVAAIDAKHAFFLARTAQHSVIVLGMELNAPVENDTGIGVHSVWNSHKDRTLLLDSISRLRLLGTHRSWAVFMWGSTISLFGSVHTNTLVAVHASHSS